jgi:hypothetical protein
MWARVRVREAEHNLLRIVFNDEGLHCTQTARGLDSWLTSGAIESLVSQVAMKSAKAADSLAYWVQM